MNAIELAQGLERIGFLIEPKKTKTQRATLEDLVVYIKAESHSLLLVIDPKFGDRLDVLLSLPGIFRPIPRDALLHNSSMRSFPKRIHKGSAEIPYGLDFDVRTFEALSAFIGVLRGKSAATEASVGTNSDQADVDPQTETEATRAARLGQSKFRAALIERWQGKCPLTGIAMADLLRASHIKPWSVSDNRERLDPDNGLLLAVHIDVLFDKGLISFSDAGRLIVSPRLPAAEREILQLDQERKPLVLSPGNRIFLQDHRVRYSFPEC
ncbi:HNH endonuclease [Phreatobacter sp. HK31-P]